MGRKVRVRMKKRMGTVFFLGVLLSFCLVACESRQEQENKEETESKTYYEQIGFQEADNEDELLAFPDAEGYGKYTVGGRGGRVIYVTNLNDSGEGSLRAAVEAEGPRTVVFKVSGNIILEDYLKIENPYITIAGQTAPGDGICLQDYGVIVKTDEVIISYLRCRPDNARELMDSLWVAYSNQVVIDHISASFGTGETISVTQSGNVTVQDCIIAESIYHTRLGNHGWGSLISGYNGQKVTFYRNLFANHRTRVPMVQNRYPAEEDPVGFKVEFINNVVYNWGGKSAGRNHDEPTAISYFDFRYNYYKTGPNGGASYAWGDGIADTHMFIEGNSMNDEVPEDQTELIIQEEDGSAINWSDYLSKSAFSDSVTGNVMTASEAYDYVLENAGCSLSRDSLDLGVINSVKKETGELIDSPSEAAGWKGDWPELESGEPYPDEDMDGMDDNWEKSVGLDPENPNDALETVAGGYTNLEVFLASLRERF